MQKTFISKLYTSITITSTLGAVQKRLALPLVHLQNDFSATERNLELFIIFMILYKTNISKNLWNENKEPIKKSLGTRQRQCHPNEIFSYR